MKKLFLIVLIILFVTSCVTQKKCLEKFPPSVDTITIVEKRDSVVYKDKIVFVNLPVETRIDSIKIPCPEVLNYKPDTVKAETSLAVAKAWWKFPSIKLSLTNKDDSLMIKLDNAIKESYSWKSKYDKITSTPPPMVIKFIPGIYKVALWLWVGVIIAIGGYTFLKIKKIIK